MNHKTTHHGDASHIPMALICAGLLALITAGCTVANPAAPVAQSQRAAAQPPPQETTPQPGPETWSGYRLYMEGLMARKQDDYPTAIRYLTLASEKDPQSALLMRERAVVHMMSNDKEAAQEVITEILKANPDDAEALLLLVRIKLSERNVPESKALLKRAIKADPTREDPYFRLGLLQSSSGKQEEALDTYKALLEEFPYSFAGHYYAGLILLDRGDVVKASQHFQEAITIAPEFTGARVELAASLLAQGDSTNAFAEYNRVLDREPENIRATLAMTLMELQKGNPVATERLTAIASGPNAWDTIYGLINRHYIAKKQYKDARLLLTVLTPSFGDLSEFNYMLGYVCEKLGDQKETMHYFKRISPNSEYFERAVLFVSIWEWENGMKMEASKTLEEALKQRPMSIDILTYLASYHEEMDQYAEAEGYLLKGVEINTESASLYFRMGVLYDKWGKNEESTRAIKRVLDIDPENPNALNFLGYTYARQGINLEDAERLVKKALANKPGDGYITDSLGWVYYKQGLFAEALAVLREAVSLLPGDPVVLEHLADVLVENDLTQEALDSYKLSIKQGHEDSGAIEKKIQQLEQKLSTR